MLVSAIGRLKNGPERDLVARYMDRAAKTGRPLGLSGFEIAEFAESRAGDETSRKREEAEKLCGSLPDGTVTVVLDERGEHMGSRDFAGWIAKRRDAGAGAVGFVIGGPDGLDPGLRTSAELVLSFSKLTWPHQLVRILLAEQLYRTTTILSGHPYHRGG